MQKQTNQAKKNLKSRQKQPR